jgi:hypothetical protein
MTKYVLKGFMVDNNLTSADQADKRLVLDATRSVDQQFVIDHMMKLFPGITRTVAEATVKQFQEALIDLVCNGYTVNTDAGRYTPSFRGLIRDNAWDATRNFIRVSITQGKRLREAIADTTVHILGDKPEAMYIASTRDSATQARDNTATAGAMLTLYGNRLKVVEGSITLTDTDGNVTDIPAKHWAHNASKRLVFLVPESMKEGDYTLTVATRYENNGKLMKDPRLATQVIQIRREPSTSLVYDYIPA